MRQPAPGVQPVLTHVSPNLADLVFFISVDHRIPANENVAYNDPYQGPNASKYPNHVLVYVGAEELAQDGARWAKHYYAADRANQDAYNFEHDGDTLTRTYLVRRALYRQNPDTIDEEDQLDDEFLWPPVATPDTAFTGYGFADDSVLRSDTELDSLFVLVRRRFLVPVQTNVLYDETIERNVTVTRELIGKAGTIGSSSAGITREREYGNYYHDWRVTSTVYLFPGDDDTDPETYPLAMTSYIVDVPYRFPELLQGARINAAWALADSSEAARSYDESWYIDWKRVDPAIGPYEARVLRFLTNNPDGLRASYPVQKIVTKRETIGIARAWAHASSKGNSTYAEARQIEVPPAIHGEIKIENGETMSVGQSTNVLPATPNFGTVVGRSSMIIAYETKQTRYGLYQVEITEINCTGVYNGVVVPFGSTYTPGVPLPDMGANDPPIDDTVLSKPSGTVSADNTMITGKTTGGAMVKAFYGDREVGRAVAGTSGNYSMTLDTPVFTDAATLTLRSYLNGSQSSTTSVTTNDLSPARPSGYLSTDGTTLQGTTEPGNTVTVLVSAAAQVETATLPLYYPQVETLTFAGTITVDNTFPVAWVSALVSETVDVDAVTGDTPAELAEKARDLFEATDVISHWNVTVNGDDLVFTARVSAADDATAEATITDPNGTGVTPAGSAETVAGGSSPVSISTAGTVIVTTTSGIAPWGTDNTPVWVEVGDDPTDIMAKVAAALPSSPVGDYYTPGASTNNLSLTVIDVAVDDPLLNITITEGTCEGLVHTPALSTDTTPGGTGATVTANGTGAYTYAFPAALSSGNLVAVTSSDAGGTSLPLYLEYSASIPTLSTAVLSAVPNSNTITGTATAAAKVIAYVGDTEVGDAIVSGGGTYSITLDYKMVRGERIQVVAVVVGNEDVRSIPLFITATTVSLEVPVFELTDAGYVGDTPSGATAIKVRKVADLTESTVVTLHTNGTFSFSLAGEAAGAAFDVYARYPQGDSDVVRIFVPTVPKMIPYFDLRLSYVSSSWGPGQKPDGYERDDPYFFYMQVAFQTWVDGMDVTISYPGSDQADITITNFGADRFYNDLSPLQYATITYPNGNRPANAYRGVIALPLDTSGPTPVPYDVVRLTLAYPDGDTVEATFNASTFSNLSWKNGDWNYGWLASAHNQTTSGDYYQP